MSNVAIVLLRKYDGFNQVFMVKNKRYNAKCVSCINLKTACKNHLLYGNPAGELERNESFMEAAKREFFEETECILPKLDKCHIYKEHDSIIIVSLLDYKSSVENFSSSDASSESKSNIQEKIINNDEIYETKWVNIEGILNIPLMGVCKKLYPKYIPIWEKILSNQK